MFPSVSIFGRAVPTYWLCVLSGILACSIVALARHKDFKELQEVDITNSAALFGVGALIGARFLYLLTITPTLIRYRSILMNDFSLAYEVLSNGMVFYGGLAGALLVLYLYTKKYGLDQKSFFDFFAPLFPLFHAFGRIGCFLTGCCHGKPSQRFGIAFTHSASAMNGIPYFPIQLVCTACNIGLFCVVLLYERRHHKSGQAIFLYLLLYAVGRLVVEFFRGDSVRGIIFGLSTSQWISLLLILFLAACRFFPEDGRTSA